MITPLTAADYSDHRVIALEFAVSIQKYNCKALPSGPFSILILKVTKCHVIKMCLVGILSPWMERLDVRYYFV